MKFHHVALAAATISISAAASALAAAPTGDATRGAALFASNCAACHSAAKGGGDGQGPNLYTVYGRKAGSEPGFAYSSGFASANFIWDSDHLDKWLTKPTGVISTTYMMYAQPDPQIRADIIAYSQIVGRQIMAKLIHSMIRVLDEAKSLAFYEQAFGLKTYERLGFDDFTLVYLRTPENDFELELTINHGRDTAYDLGNGYGHLAVNVADLDAEHSRLSAAGLAPKPIKQFDKDGRKIARFFFIEDPDGYKIEVLERSGRFI